MIRYRVFVSVAMGITLAIACSSQSTRNLSSDGGVPGDASVGDDDDEDASTIPDAAIEPREDATGSGGSNGSGGSEGLGGLEGLGGYVGLGGLIEVGGLPGVGGVVIEPDGGPLPDASPPSGGTGGIVEPPVTGANAFMGAYLIGLCEASARCCAQSGNPVTADGCIGSLLPAFQEDLGDLDANPNIEFQPEHADSCLEAVATLGCDDPAPEVCAQALMGTQSPGDACTQDMECIPVLDGIVYCEVDPWEPALGQVCVAYSGDQTGQPCSETCTHLDGYVECLSTGGETGKCITNLGFFCDETTWTCQPSRAEGESCNFTEECQFGRACALNLCVPESQVGDPCDPMLSEPLVCARDAYCTSVGECAPAGLTGVSCISDEECVSDYCSSYQTCESPTLLACDTLSLLSTVP